MGESLYDTHSGRQIFAVRHQESLSRFIVLSWMTAEDLARLDGSADLEEDIDAPKRRYTFGDAMDRMASVRYEDSSFEHNGSLSTECPEIVMNPVASRRITEPADQRMWLQACRSDRSDRSNDRGNKRCSSSGVPASPKYNGLTKNGHT